MKKNNLLAIVTVISLVFSSCSTSEEVLSQDTSTSLLKSYSIKRDKSGAYSLDYNLAENTATETNTDLTSNTNEVFLYASDQQLAARQETQNLAINKNQLKVGFIDQITGARPQITVVDDKIRMARNTDSTLLEDYVLTANQDDTYTIDFNVKTGVEVDFTFNEEEQVYEIHLEKGEGTVHSFQRTFTNEQGESQLKVTFVNHVSNSNARSASFVRKKPRIVIDY